ncbi:MAG: NAD(+)/NADH kinase [Acidimicrobiales bacterium]
MTVFGLVLHQERTEAVDLALEATRRLEAQGHEVRLPMIDARDVELLDHGVPEDEFARGLDVAVSLGGDGCMLRAVQLVAAEGVAVLGVNLGQLGYLTEIEPSSLWESLDRFVAGDFAIEERMLLQVTVLRSGGSPSTDGDGGGDGDDVLLALNEAVLEKTPSGHTVRLDVQIDGREFTPYAADGLIVATATGSTAYNLSARGPIVAPTHRAMVLTPVSPHMLFDRSLVLEPETVLRLTVSGHRAAALAVDGRMMGELEPGEAIECTASEHRARLVVFGPRDFHHILKAKFRLSDR